MDFHETKLWLFNFYYWRVVEITHWWRTLTGWYDRNPAKKITPNQ
jgi:hypothetical protein